MWSPHASLRTTRSSRQLSVDRGRESGRSDTRCGPVVRIHYINHPSRGNTALQSHESSHKQRMLPQGNEHQGNEPGNRSHMRARGIRTWDGGSLCGALCTGGESLQWAFCIGSRVPQGSLYRASGHGTKGPPAGPSTQGGGSLRGPTTGPRGNEPRGPPAGHITSHSAWSQCYAVHSTRELCQAGAVLDTVTILVISTSAQGQNQGCGATGNKPQGCGASGNNP